MTQARHRFQEQGDKAGKVLAHHIRESAASRLITEIHTSSGLLTVNQQEMNDEFKQFYSKLYSSESAGDPILIKRLS